MVTLADIQNTVRRMTARYSETAMPTVQLNKYINLAYTIHLPLQFRNIKLNKPYVFLTTPNIDTYAFPYENGLLTSPAGVKVPGNIEILPPVYCQGYMLRFSQDKSNFYNSWPKLSVNQIIDTGDGTAGPYTGTLPGFPFLRAQLDIFGNVTEAAVIFSAFNDTGYVFSATDVPLVGTNSGNLVTPANVVVGSVNYVTGVYSLATTIPSGTTIYASVVPYQPSRPTDVIFTNQQITFRPVPAQVYHSGGN